MAMTNLPPGPILTVKVECPDLSAETATRKLIQLGEVLEEIVCLGEAFSVKSKVSYAVGLPPEIVGHSVKA